MFIVALTGGIATGKTTVLEIFAKYGIPVINADHVARDVINIGSDAFKMLKTEFGPQIINKNGKVDREVLGRIVFEDKTKLKRLNAITHPSIERAIRMKLIRLFLSGHSYVVIELPLLFETGSRIPFLHKIITVTCHDKNQIKRLCMRNNFTREEAMKRIDSQLPMQNKVRGAHFVVNNDLTPDYTLLQVEHIIEILNADKRHWKIRMQLLFVILMGFISLYLIAKLFNWLVS